MQVDTGRINLHQLLKTRAQSGYWHSIKHTKGSKAQLGLHGVPVVFGTAQCEPLMPAYTAYTAYTANVGPKKFKSPRGRSQTVAPPLKCVIILGEVV